ncbi:MAG: hypothetical protein ABFS23_12805, partial [Pseudomonadota bacterium]
MLVRFPGWTQLKYTLALSVALMLLAGCGAQPGRRADTVIPSAHTGGSALAISQDSKTLVSG